MRAPLRPLEASVGFQNDLVGDGMDKGVLRGMVHKAGNDVKHGIVDHFLAFRNFFIFLQLWSLYKVILIIEFWVWLATVIVK